MSGWAGYGDADERMFEHESVCRVGNSVSDGQEGIVEERYSTAQYKDLVVCMMMDVDMDMDMKLAWKGTLTVTRTSLPH